MLARANLPETQMRFEILGTLRVHDGEDPVEVTGTLLGAIAVLPRHVTGTERKPRRDLRTAATRTPNSTTPPHLLRETPHDQHQHDQAPEPANDLSLQNTDLACALEHYLPPVQFPLQWRGIPVQQHVLVFSEGRIRIRLDCRRLGRHAMESSGEENEIRDLGRPEGS